MRLRSSAGILSARLAARLVGGEIDLLDADQPPGIVEGAQRQALGRAGGGALDMQRQPRGIRLRRAQQGRKPGRRIGEDGERAQLAQTFGQLAAGIGIGAGEPVGEPDHGDMAGDLRLQIEMLHRRQGRGAVRRPGAGLQHADLLARLGRAQHAAGGDGPAVGRRRGGEQDDGNLVALGLVHRLGHAVLAVGPAGGGGPAVVHHQHQGALALELAMGIQQRPGESQDDQGRQQQAHQDQPERRAIGRLLLRDQIEEQADGREAHPARRRRRQAQQPPQQRQRRQAQRAARAR